MKTPAQQTYEAFTAIFSYPGTDWENLPQEIQKSWEKVSLMAYQAVLNEVFDSMDLPIEEPVSTPADNNPYNRLF